MTELQQVLKRIDRGFSRASGSLDPVHCVAQRLGVLPPPGRTAIIGGTNGKSSTALVLERLLQGSGGRVGTTISPHVERFNERIRIGGREAYDYEIAGAMERVLDSLEGEMLSYFDIVTLTALEMFRSANLDFAVLEVGLGGRLDATNVVDSDLAVVTNVALDHQEFLGSDRERIGFEKAGIFRRKSTVVIGDATPPESLLGRARELDCKTVLFGQDYFARVLPGGKVVLHLEVDGTAKNIEFQMPPALHLSSICTACQAASHLLNNMSREVLEPALQLNLPGRWEFAHYGGREWLLDVAHNPAAVEDLADRVKKIFPKRQVHCLFAARLDKDVIGMLNAMRPTASTIAMTELDDRYAADVPHLGNNCSIITPLPLGQAVRHLIESSEEGDLIVVFGSFALVGRIRKELRAC